MGSLIVRVDEEPVLVNQACFDEGVGQRNAASDDDVEAVLLLEVVHPVAPGLAASSMESFTPVR